MKITNLHTLLLPVLAMAVSAAATAVIISPDTGLMEQAGDEDKDDDGETLLAAFPVEQDHSRVDAVLDHLLPAITSVDCQPSSEPMRITDVWERIRSGLTLPNNSSHTVQSHLETFSNHPRHLEQILERGAPYLHYILNRIEDRGLPVELALLPAVESAYDPFATSPAGAAGLWQFMPRTAEYIGLDQNGWYDKRRDIIESTEAALDYLARLQKRFDGDWFLALAAYNAGGARVQRAIQHNRRAGKPVDYWHLPLPEETRNYVPKLIALQSVIKEPSVYNIRLPEVPDTSYFAVVETGGQIELHVAARLAGVSENELQRLNPGISKSITPPVTAHKLLIPRSNERQYRERLALLPDNQRVQSVRHTVRWGDTLSTIAQFYSTSVNRLRKINRLDGMAIIAGETLIVPVGNQGGLHGGEMQAALM